MVSHDHHTLIKGEFKSTAGGHFSQAAAGHSSLAPKAAEIGEGRRALAFAEFFQLDVL